MFDEQKKNPETGEFKKEISLFGGVSIVAGIMIGSGIFYLGSYVLQAVNYNVGLALICWIIGGLISLLGGFCFAELGASRPKAGGLTVYLNEVYHPIIGYMYGFSQWLLASPGSIAAIAIAIPTAFIDFFPGMSNITIKVIAIVLIILFTLYNAIGVKEAAVMNNIFFIAKILPMIVIMVSALFLGSEMPNLNPLPTAAGGPAIDGGTIIKMIALAVVSSLWAYEGWSNVSNLGEELREPKKNLPKMMILGIGGVTIFYLLFNFAIFRVLPVDEAQVMIEADNVYLGTEVAKRLFGNIGSILVVSAMLLAMIGSLNGFILAFSRIAYAMAEEGHFFKSHAKLSKRGVPVASLTSQAIISCVLVVFQGLDQLTTLVVFLGMIGSLLGVAGVIVNRVRFPELEKPYKLPGYPFTAILSTAIFALLMINNFIEDPFMSILGLVIVPAIGAGIYIFYDKKIKSNK